MKLNTNAKNIMQIALIAVAIIACSVLWAYVVRRWEMATQAGEMDRRELAYDADDDFIMIDTQHALMGVYCATKPLRHIWKERLRTIPPGLYYASICDGWLELWNHDMRGVYVIWTTAKENTFFWTKLKQDSPVLVY